MGGQAFYQSSAFNTADGSAPLIQSKCVVDALRQGISRTSPEIFAVVAAINVFPEIEAFHGHSVGTVGQAQENVRKSQDDVA